MSDQDLSGNDLKVVQYVIVDAGPYTDDALRLGGKPPHYPKVIATSDDLTPEEFTAWMIARDRDQLPDANRQYLRVVYSVINRVNLPTQLYEKDQVKALRQINLSINRGIEQCCPPDKPCADAADTGGTASAADTGSTASEVKHRKAS